MKVYKATLDRFGYDLTVVCKTKKECEEKLMAEYEEHYKAVNDGNDPRKLIAYDRHSGRTYYDQALEDMYIYEYELGKVEWE